ncbi:MAG: DUF1707 and DUF2154 domain-containing protein [Gemmatimonadetes bacterium]|nr:DUF1707 and DUF2154 domain-containing protein [Gemmatimonadota bacterium]
MADGTLRERVVDSLGERFAEDLITVEEFERRVDLAYSVSSVRELEALLTDLPEAPGTAPVVVGQGVAANERGPWPAAPLAARQAAVSGHAEEVESVVAVFGGTVRGGSWRPARKTFALALFGGADIDLREAELPTGVTELHVVAAWGGVDIVVPPDLVVEIGGMAVFGGFDRTVDGGSAPVAKPDSPVLRIKGLAFMGGVDVTARYPGESVRDAKRRLKIERKERKIAAKARRGK